MPKHKHPYIRKHTYMDIMHAYVHTYLVPIEYIYSLSLPIYIYTQSLTYSDIHLSSLTAADSKNVKHGCGTIHAGAPSFCGLELEDSHVPTVWLLLYLSCSKKKTLPRSLLWPGDHGPSGGLPTDGVPMQGHRDTAVLAIQTRT